MAGRRVLVAVESGPVAHTGRDWRNNLNQDSNSFNQDSGVGVSGPAARVGADSGGGGAGPHSLGQVCRIVPWHQNRAPS